MTRTIYAADLFAGAGGTSTGLAQACRRLGITIDLLAVNHWKIAVESHQANHPWARHVCERVESLDPQAEVPGGRLDVLSASPECRYFSRAAGNRRLNDQQRASAWHLLPWIEQLDVRALVIENVKEFINWCRCNSAGRPIKEERGQLFRAWVSALVAHGYTVEWRCLNAADYGAATSRERFFLVARKGCKPIYWPHPTHSRGGRIPGTLPWRAALTVRDLTRPTRSVFGRVLARNTWRRILTGVGLYSASEFGPFLVNLRAQLGDASIPLPSTEHPKGEPFLLDMVGRRAAPGVTPKSASEPMDTIVAARCDRYVTESYLVRTGCHPPGDRIGAQPRSTREPMQTLTSAHGIGVCQPFLVPKMSEREGQRPRTHSTAAPFPTIHSRPPDLADAFLVQYNSKSNAVPITSPFPTVTTHDRFALVQPVINGVTIDIRMRLVDDDELAAATGFPAGYRLQGSRSARIRQVGNAVPVPVAEAIFTSLLTDRPTPMLDALAVDGVPA